MASESSETSAPLPEDLSSWLDDRAREMDVESDELLRQLVAAYRVGTEGEPATLPEARLDALEDDVEKKLDDVRRRVVQVKQETDSKSAADHGHQEFARLEALDDRTESLAVTVDELRKAIESHGEQFEGVDDRLDDVTAKLTRVASAVVDLQSAESNETLVRIKQTAAREGYDEAACAACGETLSVAPLAAPTCPHCDAAFDDVEPVSGWFSKPELIGANDDE